MVDILSSKNIVNRNIKFFWFGDTGTRKTETILRYFPKVLLIDAEGNADKAADNPDIPEFLLATTKDAREILNIIDQVSKGKLKFPDGSPVLTVGSGRRLGAVGYQQGCGCPGGRKPGAPVQQTVRNGHPGDA